MTEQDVNPVAVGVVTVPRSLVETVTIIANRNEQSLEGDALAVLLSAASPVQDVDPLCDHERIWLQNAEDAKHQGEGRMWCQNKVWPDDTEDGEPTEYVRADLYREYLDRALAAEDLLAEAREALEPFAKEAGGYDPDEGDDDDLAWSSTFTMGNLRHARATLSRLKPGEKKADWQVQHHDGTWIDAPSKSSAHVARSDGTVRAVRNVSERCHADRDGDCNWTECPQACNRQSHCPLDAFARKAETPKGENDDG